MTSEHPPATPTVEAAAVTVVIPARNAAATIDEQLRALAAQDFDGPVEVLVVDNDSTDDTAGRTLRWADRLDDLRVVRAGARHNVSHARNAGFAAAQHDIVLVCDADDVVGPRWISQLVTALGDTDIVGGGTVHWRGGPLPSGPAQPFDTGFGFGFGFLDSFIGCNFGLRVKVWRDVGGFDEELASVEDVDFAWRAQLAGYRLATVPHAFVYYRIDDAPGHVFRKWRHYGTGQPALYRRFAANGMPRQPVHRAMARWAVLLFTSYRVLVGPAEARERWMQDAGRRVGRLVGSVRHRTLFL